MIITMAFARAKWNAKKTKISKIKMKQNPRRDTKRRKKREWNKLQLFETIELVYPPRGYEKAQANVVSRSYYEVQDSAKEKNIDIKKGLAFFMDGVLVSRGW